MPKYLKKVLCDANLSLREMEKLINGTVKYRMIKFIADGEKAASRETKKAIEKALRGTGKWDGKRSLWSNLTDAELDRVNASQKKKNGGRHKNRLTAMRPTVAKKIFKQWGITTHQVSRATGFCKYKIDELLNNGPNPPAAGSAKYGPQGDMVDAIESYIERRYPPIVINILWNTQEGVEQMEGKKLFEITIDRFGIEKAKAKEFMPNPSELDGFMWPALKVLRKEVLSSIEEQGTLCIIGPSGCGKTSLMNSIARDLAKSPTLIIRPACVTMEKVEVGHLLEALCLGAGETLKRGASHELRSRQTFDALVGLRDDRNLRPVMIIEESHLLNEQVIRTFKRFMEWEDGAGRRVLGIVMLAQEEMRNKMGPGVRQFWNRCVVRTFPGLVPNSRAKKINTTHVVGYIKHRLERAGLNADNVFEGNALSICAKAVAQQDHVTPLMINNLLVAQLNEAAGVSEKPKITAEHAMKTHLRAA